MESTKSKLRQVELGGTWKCECGKKHEIGVYALAHWSIPLIHTCETCGATHILQNGWLKLEEKKVEVCNSGKTNTRKKPCGAGNAGEGGCKWKSWTLWGVYSNI